MSESLPKEVIVNIKDKSVLLTDEVKTAFPHALSAFRKVDEAFLAEPEKYLKNLETSCFSFKSETGPEVACSLLYNGDSKPDEVLLVWAPFSDGAPESSAEEIYHYINMPSAGGIRGMFTKEQAKPNSWNQTTKSAVIFELLGAVGANVPVLTIYSPVSPDVYSPKEKTKLKQGDFSPATKIALEALLRAQEIFHGAKSETQIQNINLHGASIGASQVVGVARGLIDGVNGVKKEYSVKTLTTQELILGPKNMFDVIGRFTIAGIVGQPSKVEPAKPYPRIDEPAIRQSIDVHGNELATLTRMAKALKRNWSNLNGLTNPDFIAKDIEVLLDNGVSVLVALAENSGMTFKTKDYLPQAGEQIIDIKAEQGQKIGHIADEYVALGGLIAALNLKA